MTREQGLAQIDEAQWKRDEHNILDLYVVNPEDRLVHAWLTMRPPYCDRGHLQLNIDGPLDLDRHDSFPRYFFSLEEADRHTRIFLKWRLWQERTVAYDEVRSSFESK